MRRIAQHIGRLTLGRPRFSLAGLVVALGFLALPRNLGEGMRPVIAWDLGMLVYLAGTWSMMFSADEAAIRARARAHDIGQWVILIIMFSGITASMVALIEFLRVAPKDPSVGGGLDLALAGWTILSTFAMFHTLFAVHYAHDYYAAPDDAPPLDFPGDDKPDYIDFLYFSFVVGLTAQVSDVAIRSKRLRRAALVHGVVSFFFNTVILALMVNIAASLLG